MFFVCLHPGNHLDIEKFTVFLHSFLTSCPNGKDFGCNDKPLRKKVFSYDVCEQDKGMMTSAVV